MCVGRSPEEALEVVLDALPTALSCEFVGIALPGSPPKERAHWLGQPMAEADLTAVKIAVADDEANGTIETPATAKLWYAEADVPLGAARGRLLVGRRSAFDDETDRVLLRSAANLVGTTLETANVLESAHRKDEFLAMLGHELRNPLAPIATAAELLARNPSAAREQQVIERHTRHLTRLVDDLLDISRVTRGHVELRNEQVSLASVLQRAYEIATPLVSRHQHALRTANAEDITLRGDPVRLAQIFGNLLTNAAKFTPPHGKIEVSVERVLGRVRVAIRDNGRGFAPGQLVRIFEPFVQVDREGDALRGGLGLGLAIVSNLVERHRGTISVHSEDEGAAQRSPSSFPRSGALKSRLPWLLHRGRSPDPMCGFWSSTTTSTSRSFCPKRSNSKDSVPPSPMTGGARSNAGAASYPTPPFSTWDYPSSMVTSWPGRCAPNTANPPPSSRQRVTANKRIAS
jgi:signal transduction histidine kinase